VVIAAFKADVFALNFWGGEPHDFGNVFGQARSTMLLTVFVFVGIEGASVYSRYARNRKDVGLATVLGFLGVLCLLVLVTILSYGILLRPDLAALRNPSMAGVLEAVVGPWGAVFISVGLLISVLGNYLSWSLLAAEVVYVAAENDTMPSYLARENANGVAVGALWLTNVVIQCFLILTSFAENTFTLALKMTSSMTLIPYLLVAAYGLRLAWTCDTYIERPQGRSRDLVQASIATIYAAGMIYAGGLKFLLLSALVYAPGTILFFIARREQRATVFAFGERVVFGVTAVAALVGLWGLISRTITV
jgi:arginine:ornithine antiporter/lysine permease